MELRNVRDSVALSSYVALPETRQAFSGSRAWLCKAKSYGAWLKRMR